MRSGGLRPALLAVGAVLCVTTTAIADSSALDEITAAAAAANRFLETLDPAQARAAVLATDSPLIANWSNLPAGMVRFERNGVRAGDLDDAQQAALFDFLVAALSHRGAELVQGVIAAEGVLADSGSRASGLGRHPDNYWLAFFGEPSVRQRLELAVRRPPLGGQRGGDRRRHDHVPVVHRHRTGRVRAGWSGDGAAAPTRRGLRRPAGRPARRTAKRRDRERPSAGAVRGGGPRRCDPAGGREPRRRLAGGRGSGSSAI